jgi:hypothetical protein
MEIDKRGMVQFLPLGLQIAEDDPDLGISREEVERLGCAALMLMSPGIFSSLHGPSL